MSSDPFAPFQFDADSARSVIADPLNGADDGELFLEHGTSETLAFDDGRLKTASFDAFRGFGLRCVSGEASGYSHSSDPTIDALKRAAGTVGAAREGRSGTFAAAPQGTNRHLYDAIDPVNEPGFETKSVLLQEIDAYLRARDPSVVQVSASIAGSKRVVGILRPDGDLKTDDRPLVRLNVSVTVERDGRRESGSAGAGGRDAFEAWISPDSWKALADEALRIARVNLDAVDIKAGQMDVVLGPGWPAVLLHEAVGHGLEGDFNRKGTSAFAGRMAQQVASKGVTVVDDGTMEKRRGSLTIDDEGTPTERTVLIEDGVLVGYMQDRQNARLMGVAPTGNGRRESYAHTPMPRMTNTYMLGGDHDPAEMLESLSDGLYAVGFGGGQVDITSGKFVFQCTEAYRVRNGRIEEPVKGATLIGDGPTALTKVSMIGNDFAMDPGVGVCGKGGQGVPVGVGQPSLKVAGLTVGGAG
ncbi:metalloprotease TldD [Hyphobacterium sp. CCMP332]|uniref:metalloprotease TldD n=1 Tax=Hyphobacterium sp. CCMP332 TaxID=2749086 RepID=UPI00164F39E9|nr:metalloprotease TldD [Hyphobacterium sp. CCMP332]QNL19278.1 metalloprotease TldD [Hyphobacterium sp. CCMP332]